MDQAKTYKWIQDRLRELHSGTLSEQDRARLWSMAEEDPFVADALEGYQKHPDPSHTEHLDVLARKIILQKRERRRWLIPNLTVTAVAASLIIIVGTWAVINRMDKKDEALFVFVAPDSLTLNDSVKNDYAVNEEQATGESISSTPSSTYDQSTTLSRKDEAANDANNKKSSQPASTTKTPEGRHSIGEISSNETSSKSYVEPKDDKIEVAEPVPPTSATEELSSQMPDKPITKSLETSRSKEDEGYYANQMDPDLMARRATGRVIDNTGQPIYGANVVIRNTNLGATTDLNGRFELFLPLPESEVEISMTGYDESRTVIRQGEEETVVILPPTTFQMENVVVGAESTFKKEKSAAGAAQLPDTSIDETVQFINFLQKNSNYPLRDNFYSPGNDVSLEFTVPSNGKPEKIKIISSSGKKDLDDEAIRLIRKGPDWTCEGNMYPCVRNYTFYFK